MLKSGVQGVEFYRDMWNELNSSGRWQGELWNRRKDGSLYAEYLSVNALRTADGSVHRYVALFTDITADKVREEQIWRHANFDPLTSLPNRRLFVDRLDQVSKRILRDQSNLALLFIDLDHFKEINDSLGHATGDRVLVEVTRRMQRHIRDTDTLARFGGDEFTLMLPDFGSVSNIDLVVQRILDELRQPFELGNGDFAHISGSIGIAVFPTDADNVEQLMQHADQAMYAAKSAGRNGFSFFTLTMHKEALEKLSLTNDLRYALGRGQLKVVFQPIVDIHTGEIDKAEALLRWQHPTRGMISPVVFIPLAEESGLILDIGEWVFEETLRQIHRWRQVVGRLIQVSVNTSPVQFLRSDSHLWYETLQRLGLPGSCLAVEITEGLLLRESDHVRADLREFESLGIELSIDDFGTGYSALSYLTRFHINYLKIDKSFTQSLPADAASLALTEAIITMARKLGIRTIAEGVETTEQRRILLGLGCDFVQGFLHSKPMSAEDFLALLARPIAPWKD